MLINRRELLKKPRWVPPVWHSPHRSPTLQPRIASVRIAKLRTDSSLSVNLTETYRLSLGSSFSSEELKKHKEKEAFELDLSKHELPDWLKGLDEHKANMTILHGISMCVSGGGITPTPAAWGRLRLAATF